MRRINMAGRIEASLMGQTETVAMLLEKGADVNAKNKYGETALQTASVLSARYHDQRARPYADIVKLIEDYIKNKENKANTMTSVREHTDPIYHHFLLWHIIKFQLM